MINEKAHLNNEQALAFCQHYHLDPKETEFFINLVNRDRAANKATRAHFQTLLDRQIHEREDLESRIQATNQLTLEQSLSYFESWTHKPFISFVRSKDTIRPLRSLKRLESPSRNVRGF